MKQVRNCVFETNSSSTHSISFVAQKNLEENQMPIDDDGYIHAWFDEFGWENCYYYAQSERLSYLLTMAMHLNDFYIWCGSEKEIQEDIELFMETNDFKLISDEIAQHANCKGIVLNHSEGYIDHQSREDYGCLDQFLYEVGTDIVGFVFGDTTIHTDNDNHYSWEDDY